MKTLIQALFSNKKRIAKRGSRNVLGKIDSNQFAKMARLGQTLVVMSR